MPIKAYAEPDLVVIDDEEVIEEPTLEEPETLYEVPESLDIEPDSQETDTEVDETEEVEEKPEMVFYDSEGLPYLTTEAPLLGDSRATGVYSSVTGGTYTDVAAHMVVKSGWNDDYLFYRSGQYSYTLVMGDLELSNTRFTGEGCKCVDFVYTNTSAGYTMSFRTSDIDVDAGANIVYSNLGDYPVLSVEEMQFKLLAYISAVALCMALISSVFMFTLRNGDTHEGGRY